MSQAGDQGAPGELPAAFPLGTSARVLAETPLLSRCSKGAEEGPYFRRNGSRLWLKHSHTCSQVLAQVTPGNHCGRASHGRKGLPSSWARSCAERRCRPPLLCFPLRATKSPGYWSLHACPPLVRNGSRPTGPLAVLPLDTDGYSFQYRKLTGQSPSRWAATSRTLTSFLCPEAPAHTLPPWDSGAGRRGRDLPVRLLPCWPLLVACAPPAVSPGPPQCGAHSAPQNPGFGSHLEGCASEHGGPVCRA